MIVEREPMLFPHLRETFHSFGVEHDDIQLEQTTIAEDLGNLSINAIKDKKVRGEDIRTLVHPQPSGSALAN